MEIERQTRQKRLELMVKHHLLITDMVQKMINEGILNEQFLSLILRQSGGNQMLVPAMIRKLCTRIETSLTEIADYIEGPIIDYAGATACANCLQRTFCSIGADSLRRACSSFEIAAAAENKKLSRSSLRNLCDEYYCLRPKFMKILQIQVQLNSHINASVLNGQSRL